MRKRYFISACLVAPFIASFYPVTPGQYPVTCPGVEQAFSEKATRHILPTGNRLADSSSFRLEGQFKNAANSRVFLVQRDADSRNEFVASADGEGRFVFTINNLKVPCTANLSCKGVSSKMYIAPGYRLRLTANATDWKSFDLTKRMEGTGSDCNQFLIKWDSLNALRADRIEWIKMGRQQFIRFIQENKRAGDSLYKKVFSRQSEPDRWSGQFARMIYLDKEFMQLYYLISYVQNDRNMSYAEAVSFVRDYSDTSLLDDLYKDEYMLSDIYRTKMMADYGPYLRSLDCRRTPDSCNDQDFELQVAGKIAREYKGRIRDIILTSRMKNAVINCRSYEDWVRYREVFPLYMSSLTSQTYVHTIDSLLIIKGSQLIKTQIGKPAPSFTATDSTGKIYSLTDYRGKVIYIDLWGSWCGPCRVLTPYYQKLYDKFKNDKRIAFISIAVADRPATWKAALREDHPTWLQLLDSDGSVMRAYSARSVPKFILVNKAGNIVSLDAPMPDDASLGHLLKEEIEK